MAAARPALAGIVAGGLAVVSSGRVQHCAGDQRRKDEYREQPAAAVFVHFGYPFLAW